MRVKALLGPPVILGLIWAVAVWWPSQMAISSANEELDRAESEQLLLVTDIDRLNQTATVQSDLESDLATIAASIPSDPAIDTFLGSLAEAAEESGVRVNLVSPTDVLDAGASDANRPVPAGLSAVAIAVAVEGSYDEVMAFAASLDDLQRLVVVDQLGMVAIDGETQLIVMDMSLRIFASATSTEEPSQ